MIILSYQSMPSTVSPAKRRSIFQMTITTDSEAHRLLAKKGHAYLQRVDTRSL